jgi:hypothetical protein
MHEEMAQMREMLQQLLQRSPVEKNDTQQMKEY